MKRQLKHLWFHCVGYSAAKALTRKKAAGSIPALLLPSGQPSRSPNSFSRFAGDEGLKKEKAGHSPVVLDSPLTTANRQIVIPWMRVEPSIDNEECYC